MEYSRNNPSPRYKTLLEQYAILHANGEKNLDLPPEQTFPGQSLVPQVVRIKRLIDLTDAETILDYGSGKGFQYNPMRLEVSGSGAFASILDYWDVEEVRCYDPCYPPFQQLPEERFDGVVCTDVLEHCPEEDIPWILEELFGFARKFLFANVACYPAKKRLPTGENAHCTVRPKQWWGALLTAIAAKHSTVLWDIWVTSIAHEPGGTRTIEERLTNISSPNI